MSAGRADAGPRASALSRRDAGGKGLPGMAHDLPARKGLCCALVNGLEVLPSESPPSRTGLGVGDRQQDRSGYKWAWTQVQGSGPLALPFRGTGGCAQGGKQYTHTPPGVGPTSLTPRCEISHI